MKDYFNDLENSVKKAYELASQARSLGFDPENRVDIPLANDIAERVEGLVGAIAPEIVGSGVVQAIRSLEKKYSPGDWRVALMVAEEVASKKFCEFASKEKALETGLRVGLAYLTLGIVSAPLEGFVELKIKKTMDGKEYIACYYAGPIRAAGGTAEALSVIIADYLRNRFGFKPYDPTDDEVERYVTEIDSYHRIISRLQYLPTDDEIRFLVRHIPVEITGDPTSQKEVLIHKDLPRVGTAKIRGGMCLVLAEGVSQKANKILPKIDEWGSEFGLDSWSWVRDYIELKKSSHSETGNTKSKVKPNYRYIEEAVAGRPIFSHPSRKGGFRLRYGRTRLSGLAATAVHPATMRILMDFVVTGSQLKIERPGKATAVTPCDHVKPPVVVLKNGTLVHIKDEEHAIELKNKISKIVALGDILVSYGEFMEQKHPLLPSPYVEEWWAQDLAMALKTSGKELPVEALLSDPIKNHPSFKEAVTISRELDIPLHPAFVYPWPNITPEQFMTLVSSMKSAVVSDDVRVDKGCKPVLEDLYIPHHLEGEMVVVPYPHSHALLLQLGYSDGTVPDASELDEVLEAVNKVSRVAIKDTAGFCIGSRLGRPEKAKPRKMKGSPQCLFPVGGEGGRTRDVMLCFQKGFVESEFPIRYCKECNELSASRKCPMCDSSTEKWYRCQVCAKYVSTETHCDRKAVSYETRKLDVRKYVNSAIKRIGVEVPETVKGVRGTTNKDRTPEALEKGILRSLHNLYVNKDGTVRYDAIEEPITHFKPIEIGVSIEKLIELGYGTDKDGNRLVDIHQILELKPQDVILPECTEWTDETAPDTLVKVARFIDDLLQKMYRLPSFYNITKKDGLVGHLIVGLAPHTSAGILGRIIGFSKTQAYYAHPYFHAAMRRNADGDESSMILLMDALLNFSRQYLPDSRGSRTMDAPLVLTTRLDPNEVDNEVHNLDVVSNYPIEFYRATLEFKYPHEVEVEQISDRLDKESQYEGIGYTHDVTDLNTGPHISSYKTLPTMKDKVEMQMKLAGMISAVDVRDVATLVIEKHFIRDIKGNLRRYTNQRFRCVNCNRKYRRVPLFGRCVCGGKIIQTVAAGTVSKYLEPSLKLARDYDIPDYFKQVLEILQRRINSLFGKELEVQTGLGEFSSQIT